VLTTSFEKLNPCSKYDTGNFNDANGGKNKEIELDL